MGGLTCMKSLDEVTLEMATSLLADPGHWHCTIWRKGDEWGWALNGMLAPDDADWVWSDDLFDGDLDPTDDPGEIESYAAELKAWILSLMAEANEEIAEILVLGHELPGVECKGPGALDDKAKVIPVVKAMLGMVNRRDGGRILLGIEDKGRSLLPVGLNSGDMATWTQDRLADMVSTYADPNVTFHLERRLHERKKFILIHVEEFDDVPVLCKKDYGDILRAGACYVRPRRKPETTEIPTQADMRDLLDLATEKRLRRFLGTAQEVGLVSSQGTPTDTDLFESQRSDFR